MDQKRYTLNETANYPKERMATFATQSPTGQWYTSSRAVANAWNTARHYREGSESHERKKKMLDLIRDNEEQFVEDFEGKSYKSQVRSAIRLFAAFIEEAAPATIEQNNIEKIIAQWRQKTDLSKSTFANYGRFVRKFFIEFG